MSRRIVWLAVQIAVTAAALWWVFHGGESRAEFAAVWKKAHAGWLAAGIGCAGLNLGLSWWRWSLFLRIQGIRPGPRRLTVFGLVGAFFDLLLPGTAGGDAAKAVLICRQYHGRKAPVVLSLMADHLSGLLALATFAFVFAGARRAAFEGSPLAATAVGYTGGFLVFALVGVALTLVLTSTRMLRRLPQRIPARAAILRFSEVWRVFRSDVPRALAGVIVSFGVFFFHFASFWCAARALDVPVSLPDMLAVGPVVDVVTMIPVSISGLGVRETLFELLLGRLAPLEPGAAAALSLAGFGCLVVWGLVGAVVFPFSGWRRENDAPPAE